MKPVALLGLLVGLLSLNFVTHAEGNCPPGYYSIGAPTGEAGPQGCAPIPSYNQQPTRQQTPQPPPPRWEDRWGAIAIDDASTNVGLGVSTGMKSKGPAEVAAIADCKAKGGADCKINFTYYNQCMAVTAGINFTRSQGAATVEDASAIGLKACHDAGVSGCVIYYSACSLPEQIR